MRIAEALERLDPDLDLGIVIKKENIFYLTGFFPTAFSVLVLSKRPYLAVSEMDSMGAKELDIEVRVIKSFKKEVFFKGKAGVEKSHTTMGFADEYLKDCEVYDIKFIDEMRQIKDKDEIRKINIAIEITEEVLGELGVYGFSEKEVAAKISYEISKKAELGFDPIVASGKNSSNPHHIPTMKKIRGSDQVIVDLGAQYEHYNCDMSRTLVDEKSSQFKEVFTAVSEAQKEGIKNIRPGSPVKDCDNAVRRVLGEYGLEKYFVHSSGHGIGLEVHEAPKISKESEDLFKEGMVVTIEPGVYIPNWGGIRIEDVVYVGKRPKVLTRFPLIEF